MSPEGCVGSIPKKDCWSKEAAMPSSTYRPSKLMQDHLSATDSDPSKAMELTPALRHELAGISPTDLAKMAESVKYSKGAPIHLTDEQNEQFKQENMHLPTFSKPSDSQVPKAPPGKFGMGQGAAQGNAMSDAWDKFEGSFEAFKEDIFKPVPAELRVGKQAWLVVGCVHKDGTGVGLLFGGSFLDSERAMGHAERLQNSYPWFDFHVVSQWGWVAFPPEEDTMRGVQRTYKDKNLDAIMRTHFETSTQAKKKQLAQVREVEANRGPRAPEEPEFPPNRILANMIDDGAAQGEVASKDSEV